MSVLRSLEDKIAGLVEGAFGRAFRSEVRPVEIARKLAREMEQHRSTSLSRTYVPNEYAVYLSPRDRERFSGYEDALRSELAGYLLEHARRERFSLVAQPQVEFRTDARLGLGEFGIQARVATKQQPQPPPPPPDAGSTMIYSSAERLRAPLEQRPGPAAPRGAVLVLEGRRLAVPGDGAVVGRSRECDIVLADPNVSRRHAELRRRNGDWEVIDLGSTNGVSVGGQRLAGSPRRLRDGDRLTIGASELTFELD